jgi:soluble lytic murein transglycosylase-like protein
MNFNISRKRLLVLFACLTAGLPACAGPATPLGSVWKVGAQASAPLEASSSGSGAKIDFRPSRQLLHGSHRLSVRIEDPSGVPQEDDVRILYDGYDVSQGFLLMAGIKREGRSLELRVPHVRLPADQSHRIELVYRDSRGSLAVARYEAPTCRIFGEGAVESTGEFTPGVPLERAIERASRTLGITPAFTAGLIAQESGFEPRRVSRARAIGLTQVGPFAETEIAARHGDWPRYPGLNELPLPFVRLLVLAGSVNSENEWRLDPELSIRGGLAYVGDLEERWEAYGVSSEEERARLVLASYHSGFTRVLAAFRRDPAGWLSTPELREARRYVNLVFSYCFHFGNTEEKIHENATHESDDIGVPDLRRGGVVPDPDHGPLRPRSV